MNRQFNTMLLAATTLGMVQAAPAWAQEAEDEAGTNDIIVTAQRIEQRLQDVPVSISVVSE